MIGALVKHFLKVCKANEALQMGLQELLDDFPNGDVGLVLSERIVNMPAAVAPASYKMLLEEIQWANDDVPRILKYCLNVLERTLRFQSLLDCVENIYPKRDRDRRGERCCRTDQASTEEEETNGTIHSRFYFDNRILSRKTTCNTSIPKMNCSHGIHSTSRFRLRLGRIRKKQISKHSDC